MSRHDEPIRFTVSQDDHTGGDLIFVGTPEYEVHVLIDTGERIGAYLGNSDAWADADNAGRAEAFGEQEVAYIGNITVTSAFRGQGLGRKLLTELLAWLDKHNVAAAFLYAMPMGRTGLDYRDLVKWYERHGFHKVSREGYSGVGESNAMMRVNPRAKKRRRRS